MLAFALSMLVLVATGGCAVHYYDPSTGTEHVWGIGHMAMRVSPATDGVRAVVRGTSALGLSAGQTEAGRYLTLGFNAERRLLVVDDDVALRLERPTGSLFSVRVGAAWPGAAWPDASWPVSSPEDQP